MKRQLLNEVAAALEDSLSHGFDEMFEDMARQNASYASSSAIPAVDGTTSTTMTSTTSATASATSASMTSASPSPMVTRGRPPAKRGRYSKTRTRGRGTGSITTAIGSTTTSTVDTSSGSLEDAAIPTCDEDEIHSMSPPADGEDPTLDAFRSKKGTYESWTYFFDKQCFSDLRIIISYPRANIVNTNGSESGSVGAGGSGSNSDGLGLSSGKQDSVVLKQSTSDSDPVVTSLSSTPAAATSIIGHKRLISDKDDETTSSKVKRARTMGMTEPAVCGTDDEAVNVKPIEYRRIWYSRLALALRSKHYRKLFKDARFLESSTNEVKITVKNMEEARLTYIAFHFLYNNHMPQNLDTSQIVQLLRIADVYGIPNLWDRCIKHLRKHLTVKDPMQSSLYILHSLTMSVSFAYFDDNKDSIITLAQESIRVLDNCLSMIAFAGSPTAMEQWQHLPSQFVYVIMHRRRLDGLWSAELLFQLLRLWLTRQVSSESLSTTAGRLLSEQLPDAVCTLLKIVPWTKISGWFVQEMLTSSTTSELFCKYVRNWKEFVRKIRDWMIRTYGKRQSVSAFEFTWLPINHTCAGVTASPIVSTSVDPASDASAAVSRDTIEGSESKLTKRLQSTLEDVVIVDDDGILPEVLRVPQDCSSDPMSILMHVTHHTALLPDRETLNEVHTWKFHRSGDSCVMTADSTPLPSTKMSPQPSKKEVKKRVLTGVPTTPSGSCTTTFWSRQGFCWTLTVPFRSMDGTDLLSTDNDTKRSTSETTADGVVNATMPASTVTGPTKTKTYRVPIIVALDMVSSGIDTTPSNDFMLRKHKITIKIGFRGSRSLVTTLSATIGPPTFQCTVYIDHPTVLPVSSTTKQQSYELVVDIIRLDEYD